MNTGVRAGDAASAGWQVTLCDGMHANCYTALHLPLCLLVAHTLEIIVCMMMMVR